MIFKDSSNLSCSTICLQKHHVQRSPRKLSSISARWREGYAVLTVGRTSWGHFFIKTADYAACQEEEKRSVQKMVGKFSVE